MVVLAAGRRAATNNRGGFRARVPRAAPGMFAAVRVRARIRPRHRAAPATDIGRTNGPRSRDVGGAPPRANACPQAGRRRAGPWEPMPQARPPGPSVARGVVTRSMAAGSARRRTGGRAGSRRGCARGSRCRHRWPGGGWPTKSPISCQELACRGVASRGDVVGPLGWPSRRRDFVPRTKRAFDAVSSGRARRSQRRC